MKRIHMTLAIAIAATLMLGADIARAEAPTTIAYQGRITDVAGDPVPDGNYTVDFRMYDASAGGALLWSEAGAIVATVDGLFNTVLGSPTPFPQNFGLDNGTPFGQINTEVWLEIEVDGEIQTPRTRLHAVPYALAARDLSGESTSGPDIGIVTNSEGTALRGFGNGGALRYQLAGNNWGELRIYDGDDSLGIHLTNFGATGGQLYLYEPFSSDQIILHSGATGDNTAVLPADAINATEMLNEPGIAVSRSTSAIPLSPSSVSQDILSVSITIPSSGYIVIEGLFYHVINNDGDAFAWVQVSETSGLAYQFGDPNFRWTGGRGYSNGGSSYIYFTTPVKNTYFKSAGTYTFYLQGNLYEFNTADVTGNALSGSWIQATYFPTSYGTVQTVVASPGDHPEATPVQIEDPMTGETSTAYSMDLRYYELKAERLRNELLQTELELEAAKRRAHSASASGDPATVQQ